MNEISLAVAEKISKLLRLSQSNNQHEAELALMHAKRIATENEIDIALIDIHSGVKKKNEPIIRNDISLGQRKSVAQRYISWLLNEHFNVKIIYSGNRQRGMTMALIGKSDKIQIALYVQSFLNQKFMELWRDYYAKTNCELKDRETYLFGLYKGLSQKLTDEQNKVESEKLANQSQETQNQWGLMVISEKDRLDEAVGQFFPSLKKAAKFTLKNYSENTYVNGVIAGKSINIKPAISNGCANNLISA